MDLKILRQPGGDPWKVVPYALAMSFVGVSGPLVVALTFSDYAWAFECVAFAAYSPVFVLATAYALWWTLGERLSAAWVLGLAVVVGCLGAQVFQIWIA